MFQAQTDCGCRLTVQSCSDGVPRLVDQNAGVVIELDDAAVWPLDFLPGSNDDRMTDVSPTDLVGDTAVGGILGAKVPLLLNDDDDPVT